MNFSEEVKNRLAAAGESSLSEERALLSAFIKVSGVIGVKSGKVGFEITSEISAIADRMKTVARELYGLDATPLNQSKKGRTGYAFYSDESGDALADMGIIALKDGGVDLITGINFEILCGDEDKAAYVKGAFLGGGSITVPSVGSFSSTGYHLEIVYSNYRAATDLCEILSELYVLPKLIDRNESYTVYVNTIDDVFNVLSLMGDGVGAEKIAEISEERDINNASNRQINCEVSNMAKQIDASVKHICAINRIDETVGLKTLPPGLKSVAEARVKYKEFTLGALAEKLGITKSCLNHRLRKIVEISENL